MSRSNPKHPARCVCADCTYGDSLMSEADTKATEVAENTAKEPATDDTKATVRRFGSTIAERIDADARANAAFKYTRIGASDEVSPAETAESEQRWRDAIEIGKRNGLVCTGGINEPACGNPSAVALVIERTLFAAPCREHVAELIRIVLLHGRPSLRVAPIDVMIEQHGPKFRASVDYIREHNEKFGISFMHEARKRS